MTRPFLLAAALLASAGDSGCSDPFGTDCEGINCGPCPPSGVYVNVFDSATGAAVEGVVVDGAACAVHFGPACLLPYRNGVSEYDPRRVRSGLRPEDGARGRDTRALCAAVVLPALRRHDVGERHARPALTGLSCWRQGADLSLTSTWPGSA